MKEEHRAILHNFVNPLFFTFPLFPALYID
jgi:hypothetical protein